MSMNGSRVHRSGENGNGNGNATGGNGNGTRGNVTHGNGNGTRGNVTHGNGTAPPLHAVILAGGEGIRLPPYHTPLPKPLVPLGQETAVIEVVLRQLGRQGFERITLAIGTLGALVRAYCEDGSRWGIQLDYWEEPDPLGTMGPLVQHLDELPEHVLVMNGDVLTDIDQREFLISHTRSGASLSVATSRRSAVVDFGVVQTDDDRIVGFQEKPRLPLQASIGVYAVSRSALKAYVPGTAIGFDQLVLDRIEDDDPPRAVEFDGMWLDLGRPEEYAEADRRWPELEKILLPDQESTGSVDRSGS